MPSPNYPPLTVRGTPRKRPIPASPEEKRKRIDRAVMLLVMQYRYDEIVRLFQAEYNLRARSTQRYITLARKRLKFNIDKPIEEVVQEAIQFHAHNLQEASQRLAQASREIATLQKREAELESQLASATGITAKAAIRESLYMTRVSLRDARAERNQANRDRNAARAEIDRIRGTAAPLRAEIKEVKESAETEATSPVCVEDAKQKVDKLLDRMRSRITVACEN